MKLWNKWFAHRLIHPVRYKNICAKILNHYGIDEICLTSKYIEFCSYSLSIVIYFFDPGIKIYIGSKLFYKSFMNIHPRKLRKKILEALEIAKQYEEYVNGHK